MRQHFHMSFPSARFIAQPTQGRTESAFQAREDTLGLPALAVFSAVESADHLSAVTLPGPLARPASVERDHGRADAQTLAGHAVVGFRVVAAIGQQAVDVQVPTRRQQRRGEQRRVVTGPDARRGGGDQVSGVVADDREFRMLGVAVAAVAVASAACVVRRAQRRREARRIDARLGFGFDQARLVSMPEDRAQQALKAPFFASLRRAWKSVVWCGSFLSCSVSRRSERSARYATMPRSSVLKNCSKASTASNWCCVKTFLENLDAYAGTAWRATCRAVLANATGDRVETRRLMVSISSCTN